MVSAVDLEPADLLGVVHAPAIHAPIDIFQRTNSTPALSPSSDLPEIAAFFRNPSSQQVQPWPRSRLPCSSV